MLATIKFEICLITKGLQMSKKSSKQQQKKTSPQSQAIAVEQNIRFIVPMPGKSTWHSSKKELVYRKMHTFKDLAGDTPLEDFQVQFLMEREYPID